MILEPISYVDCAVFILFLIPQLLISVNWLTLLSVAVDILPFFLVSLPFGVVRDQLLTPRHRQPPFVQHATGFQDLVIRCVRYAFANMPAAVGRVFFSKAVALPFMRFRMLRQGILFSPVRWYEVNETSNSTGVGVRGLWITSTGDDTAAAIPDLVVYYIHGGGFSMGSAYFYLEPLIALRDLLLKAGYRNPAIFALEYTLVPDAAYPTQLYETAAGYNYVLSRVAGNDAGRVVVSGDSAGGTLGLSLLLHLAKARGENSDEDENSISRPGYAAFISPWTRLVSAGHVDTASDYLNANSLHLYGSQYACGGTPYTDEKLTDPLVSPGDCTSPSWWRSAAPRHGIYCTWGSEEVLASDVRELLKRWRKAGLDVTANEEPGGIHAWVIARLFLEERMAERAKGMLGIVRAIRANIDL